MKPLDTLTALRCSKAYPVTKDYPLNHIPATLIFSSILMELFGCFVSLIVNITWCGKLHIIANVNYPVLTSPSCMCMNTVEISNNEPLA